MSDSTQADAASAPGNDESYSVASSVIDSSSAAASLARSARSAASHQSATTDKRSSFGGSSGSGSGGEVVGAKVDMDSKERLKRWRGFVQTHAKRNNVGTHPWFAAIATVLRLQALVDQHAGAGKVCLEWELDDAVLMEAGGDAFTDAAVAALKGTLGWSEVGPHLRSNGMVTATTELDDPFSDPDPASSVAPLTRAWIVSATLTNPELRSLARCIPSHVFARSFKENPPDFRMATDTVPARSPKTSPSQQQQSKKEKETDVEGQKINALRLKSIRLPTAHYGGNRTNFF
ncbi:hypothetical protein CBOM_04324 [Ceraceosorus bombacis]|uniref:Uncharacterized protein n=1 Tax=Ceraceosorus bombacis TaxID=401625 RepID=A0A0P1BN66_9BASI|nr:hypothetical protein CBOM_04324 [Ceraceosorus bombacis]